MSARAWGQQPRYRIVRMFFRARSNGTFRQRRGLPSNLTLAQAQEHCRDLNTSSTTAWKTYAVNRTKRYGPWFDAYEEQPS